MTECQLFMCGCLQQRGLICLWNVDCFPFRIVESVHGFHVGQHAESAVADECVREGDNQADPESNGHQFTTLPGWTEAPSVLQLESLQLDVGKMNPYGKVGLDLSASCGSENARVVAAPC